MANPMDDEETELFGRYRQAIQFGKVEEWFPAIDKRQKAAEIYEKYRSK